MTMEFPVVAAAQGNSKLVADFAAQRALLRKAQMMSIRWRSAAHQTTVTHHRANVFPITNAPRFG
jgi:hypothetical protein